MDITARAYSNIALIKYWGKTDELSHIPAVPSLSMTLDCFYTTTSLHIKNKTYPNLKQSPNDTHTLILNGVDTQGIAKDKVCKHIERVCLAHGLNEWPCFLVTSDNNFPTASGLASSASAFAALTIALKEYCQQRLGSDSKHLLNMRELSVLARMGSASAARSLFGGFVQLHTAGMHDSRQAYAEPVLLQHAWPQMRLVVGLVTHQAKEVSSTKAMAHTKNTARYYASWVDFSKRDLERAIKALHELDFESLGQVAETSALCMHALAMSAEPAIVYLKGVTLDAYHAVCALRKQGVLAYFTCDAGPHPKVLTLASHVNTVRSTLAQIPGVLQTIEASLGPDAHLIHSTIHAANL